MLTLRDATPDDAPLIRQFIVWLAEYEREPDAVRATVEDILRDGFGKAPYFRVVIAEWDKEPAGFAFYFFSYSTWLGRPSLYLEDLFVRPVHRGKGIGAALLRHLARIAVDRGCGRFVWQVLDWNEPSIRFYESLGAKVVKEWLTMRVDGEALRTLAESAGPPGEEG
jgi:GNAT superfamily N-acetyltransferase